MTAVALRILVARVSRPVQALAVRVARPVFGRARARVAVLSGLAAVILAHVWLAVRVEARRPEWRDPEYFHRQKRLDDLAGWHRAQGRTKALVAVVGGSRPQMGLSPEALGLGDGPNDPLAFNLAQSGCLPVGERLNVARLLAGGPVPDFLLVEVLPPVLADPGPMEARIPAARVGYVDLARLRPYHADPGKLPREWLQTRAGLWHALRLPLLANWGYADDFPPGRSRPDFLWKGMTLHGWSPFGPAVWTADDRDAQTRVVHATYGWLLADFRIQPVNDRAYRDLLTECRDRGVKAALFVMPESPTFRSWYPPGAREQVAAYLGGLAREYGVPVFDASAWIDDEEAFMDSHHLIGRAATDFSTRFGRECVGPWVRGTLPTR